MRSGGRGEEEELCQMVNGGQQKVVDLLLHKGSLGNEIFPHPRVLHLGKRHSLYEI